MNDRFNRFKFRTWNKKTQKMKKVIALIVDHGVYYSLMVNENEAVVTPCEQPYMVLMQCTGLKDKNGVLIYDGDILQDSLGNIFEVSFIKYCYYIHEIKRHHWSKLDEGCTSYEVIGNIYENPELLEEPVTKLHE